MVTGVGGQQRGMSQRSALLGAVGPSTDGSVARRSSQHS